MVRCIQVSSGCVLVLAFIVGVGCGSSQNPSQVTTTPVAEASDTSFVPYEVQDFTLQVPSTYQQEALYEFASSDGHHKLTLLVVPEAPGTTLEQVLADVKESVVMEAGGVEPTVTTTQLGGLPAQQFEVEGRGVAVRAAVTLTTEGHSLRVIEEAPPGELAPIDQFQIVCMSLGHPEPGVVHEPPPDFQPFRLGSYQVCVPSRLEPRLMSFRDPSGEQLFVRVFRRGQGPTLDQELAEARTDDYRQVSSVDESPVASPGSRGSEARYEVTVGGRSWPEHRAQLDLPNGVRLLLRGQVDGADSSRFSAHWSSILRSVDAI